MRFTPRNGLTNKLSYANIVATMALFIALGGVSWAAASLPKNSVGTKQIKKNGVTSTDIKKNSVTGAKVKGSSLTGSDIKANSLTGDDVNEATLGEVPLAATTSQQLLTTAKGTATASNTDADAARAAAAEVPLLTHGQISIYGKCFVDTDDNRVHGEIYARTSADGGLGALYNETAMYGQPLNTSTPETDRIVADSYAAANSTGADFDYDASKAVGPDGNGLFFSSIVEMNNNQAGAPALYPGAQSCIFTVQGLKLKM